MFHLNSVVFWFWFFFQPPPPKIYVSLLLCALMRLDKCSALSFFERLTVHSIQWDSWLLSAAVFRNSAWYFNITSDIYKLVCIGFKCSSTLQMVYIKRQLLFSTMFMGIFTHWSAVHHRINWSYFKQYGHAVTDYTVDPNWKYLVHGMYWL